ncbi:MAG: hypothetical protein U1E77_10425 [Inhella sp.]
MFTDISGRSPAFVDTVTVDGQTVRFEVKATGFGRQFLFDEFGTQHTGADYLYTDQRGLAQGDTLRAASIAPCNTCRPSCPAWISTRAWTFPPAGSPPGRSSSSPASVTPISTATPAPSA